jgi:hypothetical protein
MVTLKEQNKCYYRYDNNSDRGELPKASPWQTGSRNSGELQPASVAKSGVVGYYRSTLWALLGHSSKIHFELWCSSRCKHSVNDFEQFL